VTDQDVAVGLVLAGSDPDGDVLSFFVAAPPAHGTLSGSGANRTYTPDAGYFGVDSFTFTVNDGQAISAPATVSITVNDVAPPTIKLESRTPANPSGWNKGPVTITWSCGDTGSGVAASTVSQEVTAEGADQEATGTCADLAGNTASHTVGGINIDKTAPAVVWNGGPPDGSTYVLGSTSIPAAPTCSASDSLSKLDGSCTITGYATTPGTHTMTATATDNAGNQTRQTRSYSVREQGLTLRGFYQPVDMNSVWNTVKGGSTVPLKFEVFAGTTELTDTSIVTFTLNQIVCGTQTVTDDIEMTTTGGTSLRYSDGQFIQNWQTPKKPGTCYKVTMTTTDGASISALFKLK
jgi:hypothetical protein